MGCGSGMSCGRRLRDWQEAGIWRKMHTGCVRRLQRRRIRLSERRRLGVDSPLPGGERKAFRHLRRRSFDHGRAAVPTATGLPRGKCDTSAGAHLMGMASAPNGIRIHVAALKGLCPRPLDDGGERRVFYPKTHTGSNRAHGGQVREPRVWDQHGDRRRADRLYSCCVAGSVRTLSSVTLESRKSAP